VLPRSPLFRPTAPWFPDRTRQSNTPKFYRCRVPLSAPLGTRACDVGRPSGTRRIRPNAGAVASRATAGAHRLLPYDT